MKLAIVRIADRGSLDERLHLRVLADTNLSYYVVLNTTYLDPGRVDAGAKGAYWFAPTPVKAGDTVVLCSRSGAQGQTKNADGTTNYFFFWGFPQPVWNSTGKCVVVMEMNTWQTSPYE